jgi:DNA-binding PadR family transcriptional regulator
MSLRLAVLGEIISRPGHGYDLFRRVDDRLEGWSVPQSSIYPAIGALRRAGLIQERAYPEGRRVPRHLHSVPYEATPEGRAYFMIWMTTPTEPDELRDELIIKLAYATADDLPVLVEFTREQERRCLERELELATMDGPADPADEPDWSKFGLRLLREQQLAYVRARRVALQEARAALKRWDASDGESSD